MKHSLTNAERGWLPEVDVRIQQRRQAEWLTQLGLAEAPEFSSFANSYAQRAQHLATVSTVDRVCRTLDWSVTEPLGQIP